MTELGHVITVHAFVETRIRVVQELKLFENIFVILQATFDPRSLVVVLVWPGISVAVHSLGQNLDLCAAG